MILEIKPRTFSDTVTESVLSFTFRPQFLPRNVLWWPTETAVLLYGDTKYSYGTLRKSDTT
jgi:hypothetical protein